MCFLYSFVELMITMNEYILFKSPPQNNYLFLKGRKNMIMIKSFYWSALSSNNIVWRKYSRLTLLLSHFALYRLRFVSYFDSHCSSLFIVLRFVLYFALYRLRFVSYFAFFFFFFFVLRFVLYFALYRLRFVSYFALYRI